MHELQCAADDRIVEGGKPTRGTGRKPGSVAAHHLDERQLHQAAEHELGARRGGVGERENLLHRRGDDGALGRLRRVVGTTLQIVGETLCEEVDLRSNERVIDVAAGNGNATLAAEHRFAEVVSTDYVGALLERGRERAKADRLPVIFHALIEELNLAQDGTVVIPSEYLEAVITRAR
jgi:SAM-dependent methyltransferase